MNDGDGIINVTSFLLILSQLNLEVKLTEVTYK